MEYIFGISHNNGIETENVKTVGETHTDLKGFCYIERNYPDNTIVDTFKVIEKYKSDESGETCLDWYTIEQHSRYTDRYTPAEKDIQDSIADLDEMVVDMAYDNILNELEV